MAAVKGAATSKSFRAILPHMAADDVTKLQKMSGEKEDKRCEIAINLT